MERTRDTPGHINAARPQSTLEAMIKGAFPPSSLPLLLPDSVDNSPFESEGTPTRSSAFVVRTPSKSPPKARSLSESTPKLAPSPTLKEKKQTSKDDNAVPLHPKTPRRLEFSKGLSLQLPPRDSAILSPAFTRRVPLSPKVDTHQSYASPGKVLPRHSRGMDFSRACTNLHHSTLAEQSSPDSSPIITQRAMMIPHRKQSINAMSVDPPMLSWTGNGFNERSAISSSLGSINMFSEGSSSSEDEDMDLVDPEEQEDPILSTPHVHRRTPSRNNATAPYGNGWSNPFSPAGGNFLNFRRSRLQKKKKSDRKSSSSASGNSTVPSPLPTSPPATKGTESNYFAREAVLHNASSRRQSLTMGTNELNISSGNDSGDEAGLSEFLTAGVIRRPVTRRGNLLPKPRAFGRIRAELFEEATPVESEVKREAEVIRQVRESDVDDRATTTHSSPALPAVASLEGIPEDGTMSLDTGGPSNGKGLFGAFSRSNTAGGRDFWDNFGQRNTPPPPPFFPREESSIMSDDMPMYSPIISQSASMSQSYTQQYENAFSEPSRGSTPQPPQPPVPPSAADGLRKANKRRRDDDLDMFSIKRRAVSPGMSVQNSPILSQSPGQRGDLWGQQPKVSREGSIVSGGPGTGFSERSNSMSSAVTPLLGPKRIGLQGMTDMQGLAEKMTLE